MEILLNIDELSDIVNNGWDESFKENEEQQIKEMLQMDGVDKLARVNIGPGADLLTICVVINTLFDTFLVASKLLEGCESWKKLITKIKGFISKKQLVSVDEEGAKLLALDFISTHYSYEEIKLLDSHVVHIAEVSDRYAFELANKPHNYYIQTYSIDFEERLILGIRSDGEVLLIKDFGLSNYGLEEKLGDIT